MKIKDLFKKMEQANQFAKLVDSNKTYTAQVTFDDIWVFYYESYKDFYKYIKEEYVKEYVEMVLSLDIKVNEENEFTCNGCKQTIRIAMY